MYNFEMKNEINTDESLVLSLHEHHYDLSSFDSELYDKGIMFSVEELAGEYGYICNYTFFDEDDYESACWILDEI